MFRQLLLLELVSFASLFLVAIAVAAYAAIESAGFVNPLIGPADSAWVGFAYTLSIGTVLVVFFGVPVYFMLLRRGLVNWPSLIALGAAPRIVFLFIAGHLGVWAIICGTVVAAMTHLAYHRLFPRYVPNPLRKSAKFTFRGRPEK